MTRTPIVPIVGGQYRFKYKSGLGQLYIGIFHTYNENYRTFDIDLYVEALTPSNGVPAEFVSLLGLPDLKRHDERTRVGIKTSDITIIDRLYICKNSIFQQRKVQWRLGMRNLYRISDDEDDDHSSFIGFNDITGSYINMEHEYLVFRMVLVRVRMMMSLFFNLIIS
jgi:hypothetical protein